MKNEALIKVYLDEKDKLINNLVKELKEHFGILEDFNNHSEKTSFSLYLSVIT